MTWNYRVIRKPDSSGGPDRFGIHEVYYDASGRIEMWTEESCDAFGESLAELKADMQMMAAALSEPVLSEADLLKSLEAQTEQHSGDADLGDGKSASGN